jgi:hypothetical protein
MSAAATSTYRPPNQRANTHATSKYKNNAFAAPRSSVPPPPPDTQSVTAFPDMVGQETVSITKRTLPTTPTTTPHTAFADAAKKIHAPVETGPRRRTDGLLQLTLVSRHPRRVHWDIPEGYCPPRIRAPYRRELSNKRLFGMMVSRWEAHRRHFVEMQGVDTYERLYGRRACDVNVHEMEESGTEEEEEEEGNGSEEGD